MQQGTIKSWWKARSRRWMPIVAWMNQVGEWCNRFEVQAPLMLSRENGTVSIGLATKSGQVLEHPWRLSVYDNGSGSLFYTVDGGRLHDGLAWVPVAGIAETALPAVDLKIWVQVKYYNSPSTPAEYTVIADGTFPESDWEADVLPDADPLALPQSGWVQTVIPIGEISAAGLVTQYLYEDQVLPYGLTYSMPRTIMYRYDAATEMVQAIQVMETYVGGVLRGMTAPTTVDVVATTDECP